MHNPPTIKCVQLYALDKKKQKKQFVYSVHLCKEKEQNVSLCMQKKK